MVQKSIIVESNQRFASEQHAGLVCVFAGATSGIGRVTLQKMASLLRTSSFYILGRSSLSFTPQLEELKRDGPSNDYVFLEAQVSLISSIDSACEKIKSAESKVDLLCMSPGGIPWQGAAYTHEGLETCFAISYYSRLRLVSNLLPLLHRAPRPRVLSILNGTKEKHINKQDLNLENKWSIIAVVNHTTLMTSLAFDYLSAHDDRKIVTFLHATPGVVYNPNKPRSPIPKTHGILWWAFLSTMKWLSGYIVRFVGMSLDETGERHAYQLTSDGFKAGSWRVDKMCDVTADNDVLVEYQQAGWADIIWEHTQRIWNGALATEAQE